MILLLGSTTFNLLIANNRLVCLPFFLLLSLVVSPSFYLSLSLSFSLSLSLSNPTPSLQEKYHVTFFGAHASRAWMNRKSIKVYDPESKKDKSHYDQKKTSKGMREAIAMANQAFHLDLTDRVGVYGFKEVVKPTEVSETHPIPVKRRRGRPKNESTEKKPKKKMYVKFLRYFDINGFERLHIPNSLFQENLKYIIPISIVICLLF
eukprot:sb/3470429/